MAVEIGAVVKYLGAWFEVTVYADLDGSAIDQADKCQPIPPRTMEPPAPWWPRMADGHSKENNLSTTMLNGFLIAQVVVVALFSVWKLWCQFSKPKKKQPDEEIVELQDLKIAILLEVVEKLNDDVGRLSKDVNKLRAELDEARRDTATLNWLAIRPWAEWMSSRRVEGGLGLWARCRHN
ncbi:hypothetical protein QBC33DRAFT_623263 [Phialemonium atrogriseum]|uniref:Uncharacterized protein n=1 Tax=Phialemonium atrogriseum TaxID=1093897 RepID=A0AAJ0BS54_9PEZI|nr:uncharacterized protein QBC33DRAFT_623263 [Phialemonium atrogriseum]KAK1763052.1 hypothetical protein QBC33DRAFT_623263 [Phialemonium atrogriseum]